MGAGGLLGCAALAQVAPVAAFAAGPYNFRKIGFDAVRGSQIQVTPNDFILADAELTFSGDMFSFVRNVPFLGSNGLTTDCITIKLGSSTEERRLGCWFSARFSNRGTDAAGDPIDVYVKVSDFHVSSQSQCLSPDGGDVTLSVMHDGYINPTGIHEGATKGILNIDAELVMGDGVDWYTPRRGLDYLVSIRLLKHGTDEPATGTYTLSWRDIDVVQEGLVDDRWREGITLVDGLGPDVWLQPDVDVLIDEAAGRVYASGNLNDSGTYKTGFVTYAQPEFSLRWSGILCGSILFDKFEPISGVVGGQPSFKVAKNRSWL